MLPSAEVSSTSADMSGQFDIGAEALVPKCPGSKVS